MDLNPFWKTLQEKLAGGLAQAILWLSTGLFFVLSGVLPEDRLRTKILSLGIGCVLLLLAAIGIFDICLRHFSSRNKVVESKAEDSLERSRTLKLEADIKAGKMELVPLLDKLIVMARNSGGVIGTARWEAQDQLPAPISRFGLHLTGSRLKQFNEAWSAVAGITREQVWNRQPNDSDEQFSKMEQMLISRLESLRKVVHDT